MYDFDEDRYSPVPTLADAHRDWHQVNGWDRTCDLDCGAGEYYDDPAPYAVVWMRDEDGIEYPVEVYSKDEMRGVAIPHAVATQLSVRVQVVK